MLDILRQMDKCGPVKATGWHVTSPEWSQSGAKVCSYFGRVTYSTFVALDRRGLVSFRLSSLIDGRRIHECVVTESGEKAARGK
jgi:hypothetical protein